MPFPRFFLPPATPLSSSATLNVLALDGGGSRGFQTLGVLREIEKITGEPLCRHFPLIYGTSVGAYTAAFLALGARVDEIAAFYRHYIPTITRHRTPRKKSEAFARSCVKAFGDSDFSRFRSQVGFVCADWRGGQPFVLRSNSECPGFGCTIARAVQASSAAYPFMERVRLRLKGVGLVELVDGCYCANNPVMFAIADALETYRRPRSELRVVSIGVGRYPVAKRRGLFGWAPLTRGAAIIHQAVEMNSESMERLRAAAYPDVATLRINDPIAEPASADFFESRQQQFDLLFKRGQFSFRRHRRSFQVLIGI